MYEGWLKSLALQHEIFKNPVYHCRDTLLLTISCVYMLCVVHVMSISQKHWIICVWSSVLIKKKETNSCTSRAKKMHDEIHYRWTSHHDKISFRLTSPYKIMINFRWTFHRDKVNFRRTSHHEFVSPLCSTSARIWKHNDPPVFPSDPVSLQFLLHTSPHMTCTHWNVNHWYKFTMIHITPTCKWILPTWDAAKYARQ